MAIFNNKNKCNCSGIALIGSLIIGIVAAFLQITAVITPTPVFFIVAFGIAILYLATLLIASALQQRASVCTPCCTSVNALLIGILGTILFAVILLVINFAATSITGAIFVGALFFFFSFMITSATCFAKCMTNCDN